MIVGANKLKVCGNSTGECPEIIERVIDECDVCGGDNTGCTNEGRKIERSIMHCYSFLLIYLIEGICGDNYCNDKIGESCSTCVFDCDSCSM